jgi:predicted nuclease of predicted toxin-antitoxin system
VKWLLDEMLPYATADALNECGHDATSVVRAGRSGAADSAVFDYAVAEERVIVTENFADFTAILEQRLSRDQNCVPVVFVRKDRLARRGALAAHLARTLDAWAASNPDPYIGPHWV